MVQLTVSTASAVPEPLPGWCSVLEAPVDGAPTDTAFPSTSFAEVAKRGTRSQALLAKEVILHCICTVWRKHSTLSKQVGHTLTSISGVIERLLSLGASFRPRIAAADDAWSAQEVPSLLIAVNKPSWVHFLACTCTTVQLVRASALVCPLGIRVNVPHRNKQVHASVIAPRHKLVELSSKTRCET